MFTFAAFLLPATVLQSNIIMVTLTVFAVILRIQNGK